MHKEDTIVIFKPIYLKVDFNNWHSWHKIRIDSGYYANLEQPQLINEEYDRKVNTYLDDKLYEKCMGDYKKIFANRINYYFPQKYASPNENLKKALDDLKDSMKEKNLQNYYISDSLYSQLSKFSGTFYLISEITQLSNGHGKNGIEIDLTRTYIIERKTHLLTYYSYSVLNSKWSFSFDEFAIKRSLKKLKKKLSR